MTGHRDSLADDRPLDLAIVVDSLCTRFEKAWRDGQDPKIETFLEEVDQPVRASALRELVTSGDLQVDAVHYRFTDKGRREAGRLFAEGFADFQKQGHGECDAGCCDGDDHSKCGDECALH